MGTVQATNVVQVVVAKTEVLASGAVSYSFFIF
jgi:hypothetical protein